MGGTAEPTRVAVRPDGDGGTSADLAVAVVRASLPARRRVRFNIGRLPSCRHPETGYDIWVLPLSGDRRPRAIIQTRFTEAYPDFSPDGRWLAYVSDASGRNEVYVQAMPPTASKWQISTAGGDKPRWRADGRELYYIAPDRKMVAVPVRTGPPFEPGVAVPLFDTNVTGFYPYDVSADGRFLLNTVGDVAAPTSSPVTIVLNWQAGLAR